MILNQSSLFYPIACGISFPEASKRVNARSYAEVVNNSALREELIFNEDLKLETAVAGIR